MEQDAPLEFNQLLKKFGRREIGHSDSSSLSFLTFSSARADPHDVFRHCNDHGVVDERVKRAIRA